MSNSSTDPPRASNRTRTIRLLAALVSISAGIALWLSRTEPAAPAVAAPAAAGASLTPQLGEQLGAPSELPGLDLATRAADIRRAVDARSQPGPGLHSLRGRVIDAAGRAVPQFRLQLVEQTPDVTATHAGGEFRQSDGRFELHQVPAGKWHLVARSELYPLPGYLQVVVPGSGEVVLVISSYGTLAGVVRDPFGAPVAGANVVGQETSALTDEHGRFAFQIDPDPYHGLYATAPGFGPSEIGSFTVAPGETLEVELQLSPEALLRCLVLDSEGQPEADVPVSRASFEDLRFNGTLEADTDSRGRVEFRGLASGTYLIMVEDGATRRAGPRAFRAEQVSLEPGEVRELILGGRREVAIELTVVATVGGKPAAGGHAYVFAEGGGLLARTQESELDALGRAVFPLQSGGHYLVRVEPSELGSGRPLNRAVTVPDQPSFSVQLDFPELGSLAGRLISTGPGSVENAHPKPLARLARDDNFDPTRLVEDHQLKVDADGSFHFMNVVPGSYTLSATGALPITGIEVFAGQHHDGFELHTRGVGSAGGRVFDGAGVPVEDAHVFARCPNGAWFARWGAETDGSGHFTIDGLAPGSYTFLARHAELVSAESAAVQVVAGESVERDLRLAPGATLRLSLTDSTGTPVEASHCRVLDPSGRTYHEPRSIRDLQLFLEEGFRTGSQLLGPLPPGPYRFEIHAPDGHVARGKAQLEAGRNEVTLAR